jgi:hypothetical protein
MNPLQVNPFITRPIELASSPGRGGVQEVVIPPLRKCKTCSGRVEMMRDVFEEIFSLKSEQSSPTFSLKKTISDPVRIRSHLVLQQKIPASPPLYQRDPQWQLDFLQNVSTQSLVRKFIEKYPADPFIEKLHQKISCDYFTFKRENRTHPEIACPKKQALEIHIGAYREKYGISIHLGTIEQLPALFERVRTSLQKPGYESFIIAQEEEDLEDGHVLPLLVFFGRERIECLIMDVMGTRSDLVESVHGVLEKKIPNDLILIAAHGRQADSFSCRTGALSLLRNAHLSLRLHNFEEGLREPLQALAGCSIDPVNVLLPGEWSYVEQIFCGSENQIAVRDCFSKKVAKQRNPRTVKIFRDQHTEQVRFCCTLRNTKDYRADFQGLVPPEGVRVEIEKHRFCIVFETVVRINTYLVHKGFKRAGLKERDPVL